MDNDDKRDIIDTVQVALRIRPLVESEISRGCVECVELIPGEPQIQVKDLAFTYNYVFPPHIGQQEFYDTAVKNLIGKLYQGYNVTILAYGQTGSGKTYSMGTNYTGEESDRNILGVIPQAVSDIFDYVDLHEQEFIFKISVSFMELYQEQCYDLLSGKPRNHSIVEIREDHRGVILPGLTEIEVATSSETMNCLMKGSEGRAVGATAMNSMSSRSHAVFTIYIYKESRADKNQAVTSKFHLVDLAGSERSKKTKATGDRLKEGIKINQGLLALGNVISALGDGTNRGYIGYRDSKLTRLLQDSLGGNSLTLMVACVSPADYNLEETVSTLRYADRARRIKNKPVVNQDAKAAEIIRLNHLVNELRAQLIGKAPIKCVEETENYEPKFKNLQTKYEELIRKHQNQTEILHNLLQENTSLCEKALLAEAAKEKIERKLVELTEKCNQTLENISVIDSEESKENLIDYIKDMKGRLEELQCEQLKCDNQLLEHDIRGTENNSVTETGDDDDDHSSMVQGEAHTMQQVALQKEMQELNRMLALKASIMKQITENTKEISEFNEYLKENESKVQILEKEKSELLQQLRSAQTKKDPTVEARRTRVVELEQEIQTLRKKCQQQANVIKIKETNEAKIRELNNEMQSIKAAKVQLIKRMRVESEKFRRWKLENEKNMCKLRAEDQKRRNAMAKMESMHAKQQNVLKRKMEEAVAANKRLKEALERQKAVQLKRTKSNNKGDAVQQWLEQEIEIQLSTVDAEKTLEELMEDRGVLTSELELLRTDIDKLERNKARIEQLQDHLSLRNTQISDLQQKILAADQENKSRSRWENIQTMIEAKHAMRYLFDVLIENKKAAHWQKLNNVEEKLEQMKSSQEELLQEYAESKSDYERRLGMLEKHYEEKLSALIKHNRGLTCGDGSQLSQELLTRVQIQEELLDKLEAENAKLTSELNALHKPTHLMTPERKPKKQNNKPKNTKKRESIYDDASDDDDDYDDDYDYDNDPEWRATPMYKRMQAQKASRLTMNFTVPPERSVDIPDNKSNTTVPSTAVKRNSDGQSRCLCRGSCSSRQCGCVKADIGCGDHCRCQSALCKNRKTISDDSDDKENLSVKSEKIESTTPDKSTMNSTTLKLIDASAVKKRKYFFYDPNTKDMLNTTVTLDNN